MDDLFEDMMEYSNKTKKPTKSKKEINQIEKIGNSKNKLNLVYFKNFLQKQKADEYYKLFEKLIVYNTDEDSKIVIFGKEIEIPRKQVAYGEPGTFYNFSGLKVNAISWNSNDELCKALQSLKNEINKQFNFDFNFVLINRYANGDDYIGYHTDDEKDLSEESPIISVTFGAERDFKFKNKKTDEVVDIVLHHGSCLGMMYPTNKYWKHSLPKRKNIKSPRINLTFRTIL